MLLDSNKGLENVVAVSILAYMLAGNMVFHFLNYLKESATRSRRVAIAASDGP